MVGFCFSLALSLSLLQFIPILVNFKIYDVNINYKTWDDVVCCCHKNEQNLHILYVVHLVYVCGFFRLSFYIPSIVRSRNQKKNTDFGLVVSPFCLFLFWPKKKRTRNTHKKRQRGREKKSPDEMIRPHNLYGYWIVAYWQFHGLIIHFRMASPQKMKRRPQKQQIDFVL